ncbi:MAG: DUF1573 domain-containing protein [Candidatus Hydrogenedentes bacterium]|nr:DUF1573 domain-containing protein [Candidatus Hydrogenedentota bacterium]
MRTTVQCSAVAVLIAASVWLVPAAVAQDAPAAAPQGGPKIESPEPEFDFGSIDNEEKVEHDFVIKNVGDALLEIARVKTSCGCTVAELKEKSLQPGAETIVSATMSIKGKQGVQTKYLTVESNDPAQPLYRLTLTGTAIASVNIEPRNLNFGRVIDDKPVSGTISVLIDEKRRPIHVTSVESTAPDQFATEVKAIEDGAKYEIVVTRLPFRAFNCPYG